MRIKLIKGAEVNGNKYKKGTMLNVTRALAIELCAEGVAISDIDVPCHKREPLEEKASKKKASKKKASKEKSEGMDVDIKTDL